MTLEDIRSCVVAYTHSGTFHADDVFATAFLRIINPDIKIKRVTSVPSSEVLAFDIGNGEFDHHSIPKKAREDGTPYASFGKLWKKFAQELYGDFVYKRIDKLLIKDLDLSDNTVAYNPLAEAIAVFNPLSGTASGDEEFMEAVDFAQSILERWIKKELKHEEETKEVENIYEKSEDKEIIVLDKHLYFHEYLPTTNALYVIFPSKRGGYVAQAIPKDSDTIELKQPFPSQWLDEKPPYITFCHSSLFMIVADTLDNAIYACKESLDKKGIK